MDKRIIWFAVIVLLVVGVIIYFKTCRSKPPVDPEKKGQLEFAIDKSQINKKDSIYYEDKTPGATAWYWDFGDSSSSIQQKGYHVYYEAGDFTIKLTINGITDSSKYVIVSGPLPIPGRVMLKGPTSVMVGQSATFEDVTPGVQHTDWLNMATYERKKDFKTYTTTFTHAGEFTISATNNVSDKEGTIKVIVKNPPTPSEVVCAICNSKAHATKDHPKPPPPGVVCAICKSKAHATKDHPIPPPPPPLPGKQDPSNDQFKSWFKAIIEHKDERLSVYSKPIKDAVKGNVDIPVKVVSKGKPTESTKLGDFYSNLAFRNKPTVLSVVADWDETNGFKGFTITIDEK